MQNKDKIVKCINDKNDVSLKNLKNVFKLIASESLMKCKPTGIPGLEELDKQMLGTDEDLTEAILLDSISILSTDDSKKLSVSTDAGSLIAKIMHSSYEISKTSLDNMRLSMYGLPKDSIDSKLEKAEESVESGKEEELEQKKESEILDKKVEKEEEDKDTKTSISRSEEDKRLLSFYSVYSNGILSELLKRYTGLFASGYEVLKPTGILSEQGILKLSGNSMVVDYPTAATAQLYKIFRDRFGLKEVDVRSVTNIADAVCKEFLSGSTATLYFPNKLLEFAYGRKAPGNNAESVNTYENHSESGSWNGYKEKELKVSLKSLIDGCLLYYLHTFVEEDKRTDENTVAVISRMLEYLQRCMSMCLLLMEYKVVNGSPSVLKIRVCDPNNALGHEDMTPYLLSKAFMGATGAVPFSYKPRFEEESFVKEYAHEFNHDISQAMPLFAYKAYDALKRQGIKINWDNIVLGKFEDGSVLRNGTHGVAMKNHLTHHIDAGSRAGKGVMTLAMLGAGIATNKVIFYLDRKPDMASLLKHLSPNMFVVNGASFDKRHDTYNMFSDVALANVPKEVNEILKCGNNWSELGDMVYMRALKLVMGIILARGCGAYDDVNLGGTDGILLIADEFKNFQESFSVIVRQMMNALPVSFSCYNAKKDALGSAMNDYYNRTGLYAVSYLNHLIADLEFLSTKRDAGFATKEVELSDIFVIGQHLEHGMLPYDDYANAIVDGRYQTPTKIGLKSEAKNKLDISKQSFGYSLVSFKTADAFFGRNMDDGREVYLAQSDKRSKAYGRLDDKASNFAYLKNFSESTRKKIVDGRLQDNLIIADSCVYFKPFLVLNDTTPEFVEPMYARCAGDEGEPWVTKEAIIAENHEEGKENELHRAVGFEEYFEFVEPMYARCAGDEGEPWVTKEAIIAENHEEGKENELHRAVGFEEYLKDIGSGDYSSVLARSSDVANFVVQDLLGYDGTWYDFITDLRPMWMFTVEDIVLASRGKQPTFRELARSSDVANFVVQDLLGYDGTWYDFITDLRPMWMFTVEDIVLASRGKQPTFRDPSKSKVLSEYYNFDESLGCDNRDEVVEEEGISSYFSDNGGGEDFYDMSKQDKVLSEYYNFDESLGCDNRDEVVEEEGISSYFSDNGGGEDFYDMSKQDIDTDKRLASAMGDFNEIEPGEEISLFGGMSDNIKDVQEDSITTELDQGTVIETGFGDTPMDSEDSVDSIIERHIQALKNMGLDVRVANSGWEATDINTGNPQPSGYNSAPDTEFGEDLANIDYKGDVDSYDKMVEIISEDLISKFGGLHRIFSLKVVGGAIIVNGYYYRCKVKDMFARNIPYDIRREINSGSIDKLFDYGYINKMQHIRDLEFDSISFVYDYVSGPLGFGNSINVPSGSIDKLFDYGYINKMQHIRDLEFDSISFVYDYVSGPLGFGNSINVPMFFERFKSLQVLTIGNNRFNRSDYLEKSKGNDLFYSPKTGRILAEAVESRLGVWNRSVWGWTKRVCADRHKKGWQRAAAGVVGGTTAAATLAGNKAVKVGKKVPGVVRDFVNSAKDLFS